MLSRRKATFKPCDRLAGRIVWRALELKEAHIDG